MTRERSIWHGAAGADKRAQAKEMFLLIAKTKEPSVETLSIGLSQYSDPALFVLSR